MDNIIEIKHLYKAFGRVQAVNDLSFFVKRGELFAFLGENGAGKSTTISILCGSLSKDSGSVFIAGEDVEHAIEKITRKIGVVLQNSVLDSVLTVKDNLRSRAALYGITGKIFEHRLKTLADMLDFSDLLTRTVGKLSGGQRRRIDIARALLHEPEILILDEPTTGLDPQTRNLLWNTVNKLRIQKEMTVFLTTHYMEEAAGADYIVILDKGQICAEGTPIELKNRFAEDYITVYGEISLPDFGYPTEKIPGGIRITVPNTEAASKLILTYPDCFTDFEVTKGKMDDVFLAVTGKNLPGGDAQ